jgi:enoyl-CoA hydratase/carnithine racemase
MPIRFEVRRTTGLITIDRPEARNAIDPADNDALADAFRELDRRDECRVGVVTGAGEVAFCAGADLRRLIPLRRREAQSGALEGTSFGGVTRDFTVRKPLIAAINGYCLAGGLELALACDIRICSAGATFALTEVKWALIPGAGGTQRLARAVPLGWATRMILSGERIEAETALRIGLVSDVRPQSELMTEALRLADEIAANGPIALAAAKRVIYGGLDLTLQEGLALERKAFQEVVQSEDTEEGYKAFAERRKPEFKGK